MGMLTCMPGNGQWKNVPVRRASHRKPPFGNGGLLPYPVPIPLSSFMVSRSQDSMDDAPFFPHSSH